MVVVLDIGRGVRVVGFSEKSDVDIKFSLCSSAVEAREQQHQLYDNSMYHFTFIGFDVNETTQKNRVSIQSIKHKRLMIKSDRLRFFSDS